MRAQYEDFWDERIQRELEVERNEPYVQVDPLQPTPEAIKLEEILGRGAAGQAWRCTLSGKRYVVKFPQNTAVLQQADRTYTIWLTPTPPPEVTRENLRSFIGEFNNFERMMEPDEYTSEFALGEHWPSRLHTDTPEENRARYLRYANAMRELRLLPGHAHMHQLLHIAYLDQGRLPLIFSTPCDGSLWGFMWRQGRETALQPLAERPSPLWLRLASHLVLAMKFMDSRGFVSVDIKADNIFYQWVMEDDDGPQMHFMVADYGLCTPSEYTTRESTDATWVPRGVPDFYPQHADEVLIRSDCIARHQIAVVLETAVDRTDVPGAEERFYNSLPPTLIAPRVPYFKAIYDIRCAQTGRQIDLFYAKLVSLLRADGYRVD
jgi:hypothetical protein